MDDKAIADAATKRYLQELANELRNRGVFRPWILEEVQDHLLEAVEQGQQRGLSLEEAQREAVERFGPVNFIAAQYAAGRSLLVYKIILIVALIVGLAIAYVDSRPTWDDTGITAFAVLAACGLLGMLAPKRPWLWALGVGIWIPVFGILVPLMKPLAQLVEPASRGPNFGSLLALAFAFVGAYAGMVAGMVFRKILD